MSDTDVVAVDVASPQVTTVEHPFQFTGHAREYFRIWIVNLALTIATLGVFSAWAKVRRERYFYGNTWVAGVPFQYLASPLRILRGRVVAVVVFGAYVLLDQLSPIASLVLLGLLLVATPWLVVSALRFRARYSAWSSITFRFVGTSRDAVKYYLLMSLLLIPTLGFSMPYQRFKQRSFMVTGHRFADQPLAFDTTPSAFYVIYVTAGVAMVVIGFVTALTAVGGIAVLGTEDAAVLPLAALIPVGAMYGLMFFVGCYVLSRITNLTYDSTTLAGHGFRSTVRARDLARIYLGNTVAVLLSLGMLVPWAQVRLARYRAEHMVLLARSDLGAFLADTRPDQGAVGAETANVFDVDISV